MSRLPTLALVAALITAGVPDAAPDAADKATAHLTPKQVSELAAAAFTRIGEAARRFKAAAPSYDAERKRWLVFYIQSVPPLVIDGDSLVVVDDLTGTACVQSANGVGPCT